MKLCKRCCVVKEDSEFHKDKHKSDGLAYYCKSCVKERGKVYRETHHQRLYEVNKERYTEQKVFLDNLKTPCCKCGESRPYLIQFHHIDPNQKDGGVASETICRSKENIVKEVKKCVCLCTNCHTEYHWFYGKKPSEPRTSLDDYLGGKLNEIQLQQDRMLEKLSETI